MWLEWLDGFKLKVPIWVGKAKEIWGGEGVDWESHEELGNYEIAFVYDMKISTK